MFIRQFSACLEQLSFLFSTQAYVKFLSNIYVTFAPATLLKTLTMRFACLSLEQFLEKLQSPASAQRTVRRCGVSCSVELHPARWRFFFSFRVCKLHNNFIHIQTFFLSLIPRSVATGMSEANICSQKISFTSWLNNFVTFPLRLTSDSSWPKITTVSLRSTVFSLFLFKTMRSFSILENLNRGYWSCFLSLRLVAGVSVVSCSDYSF